MSAVLRIDRPGNPGIPNRARTDVQLGEVVSLVSVGGDPSDDFQLLSRPTASATAIVGTGATRTIAADAVGGFRIKLRSRGNTVVHTFKVRTINLGIAIPAHNERANPTANLHDIATNPEWIEESESNEDDDYRGWHEDIEDALLKLDSASSGDVTVRRDLLANNADDFVIAMDYASIAKKVSTTGAAVPTMLPIRKRDE
jgi:hypothetical protein